MKIKTFEFIYSDCAGTNDSMTDDYFYKYRKSYSHPMSVEEMDREVNEFCFDKEVIDIRVQQNVIRQHNNGGFNSTTMIYTVLYKG